jgi:hypothetical protein
MTKSKLKWYWKNYATQVIRLDQFALASMGLIQSQTVLKIANYMIVCAPHQISMQKSLLFVVLNKNEIPFFNQYKEKLAALKLTFQKTLKSIPLKFFVWVIIKQISPIKGKENMCLIEVVYKNCPEDLISIIGQYISILQVLEKFYHRYKGREIPVDRHSSRVLQYNNYIECFIGNRKVEAKLISLAVNGMNIILPGNDPLLQVDYEFKSKLYFRPHRFLVKGKIGKIEKRADGYIKITYLLPYVPVLVDIIRQYFTRVQSQPE